MNDHLDILTSLTFALGITCNCCIKTLTVFFLTLGFSTVTYFFLYHIFTSTLPHTSNTLYLLYILYQIQTIQTRTLISTHLPWWKTLTVQLQTSRFFTYTPHFLFFPRCLKTIKCITNPFSFQFHHLFLLYLLNRYLITFIL
jgi:hypothetical protein